MPPEYLYQHPETEEVKSVFQKMTDEHIFIDESGIRWQRLFTKPQAAISTISKIDPNNPKQFVDVTGQKRGKYGDLLDLSKELSEKRESKEGRDKVKQEFYDNYAKTRKGKRHINEKKEKLKQELKNNSILDVDI